MISNWKLFDAFKEYKLRKEDVAMDETSCFALSQDIQENLSMKTITVPYTETIKAM